MEKLLPIEYKIKVLDYLEKSLKINNQWKSTIFCSSTEIKKKILKKSNNLLTEFHRELGILGATYILINKSFNRIEAYQGKRLEMSNFKNYPFGYENVFPSISIDHPYRKGYDIIEMLAEEKRDTQVISGNTSFSNPEFFKFLDQKKITSENYLYCDIGEVLFFVYIWLWLIRYGQYHGTAEEVQVKNVFKLKNDYINPIEKVFSGLKKDISEYEIVERFEELQENDSFKDILTKILNEENSFINDYKFEAEWRKIGFDWKDSSRFIILYQKLISYLIKNDIAFDINIDPKDLIKSVDAREAFHKSLIKGAIDYLLLDSPRENVDVSYLLQKLHEKARFPILIFYYTCIISDNHLCEHFIFPLSITEKYTYEVDRKDWNIPVFGMLMLRPNFFIEEENIQYLNYIQLFYSQISSFMMDEFYENILKYDLVRDSYDSFVETLNHEASKVVSGLRKRTISIEDLFALNDSDDNDKIGKCELNKGIDISNFRIIPNYEVFLAAIDYLAIWHEKTPTGAFKFRDFFDSIFNEVIKIHAISSDKLEFNLNSYDCKSGKQDIDDFNKMYLSLRNKIKEHIELNISFELPWKKTKFQKSYAKLLYVTLMNSLKNTTEKNIGSTLKINIYQDKENESLIKHEFITHFSSQKTEAEVFEINLEIENKKYGKVEKSRGTRFQIEKHLSKVEGQLDDFRAYPNSFNVIFTTEIDRIIYTI